MKQLLILIFGMIFLISCKKDNPQNPNTSAICFETTYLDIGNTNQLDGLASVFFQNGKDGYVTSYHGGIYKTLDSAKTWTALNSTTTLPIRDIFFFDSNKGIAVGGLGSCSGNGCIPPGGFIIRTVDGGMTWHQVFAPSNKLEITSIHFVDDLLGFCVGNNIVYKTVDGGQSWVENPIENLEGQMTKIRFTDKQNGIIVCSTNKILKTTNGGSTWQIIIPSAGHGFVSLSSFGQVTYVSGAGKILKSIDRGISWNELPNSPDGIYDIHFTSKDIGFAFGRGNYSGGDFGRSYGAMYCTNNGGYSWNGNGDFNEVGIITAASFPSDKLGYAIAVNKIIKIIIE